MIAKTRVLRTAPHEWRAEFRFEFGVNAVIFRTWREAYDYALDAVQRHRARYYEPSS